MMPPAENGMAGNGDPAGFKFKTAALNKLRGPGNGPVIFSYPVELLPQYRAVSTILKDLIRF